MAKLEIDVTKIPYKRNAEGHAVFVTKILPEFPEIKNPSLTTN